MRSLCLPPAFSHVPGSKTHLSHSKPCLLLVHPLLLAAHCQLSGVFGLIQLVLTFSAFIISKGARDVPSAQMHSNTETHSCRSGSTLYRVLKVESMMTRLH